MGITETVVEEAPGAAAAALPAWVGELTRNQRRDIKACLPFLFKALEDGSGWAWHAEHANMTVTAKFGGQKNSFVISVHDEDAGDEIGQWRTELRLTGQWMRRLRQFSGESLVLCQSRHKCPKCGAPVVLVRRRDDGVQFFGCSKYRSASKCNGSLSIIDHDVERPS